MKKLRFLFVLFAFSLISNAQSQVGTDREMAEYLRRVTDRTSLGLVEMLTPNGAAIDLNGRFHNVALARIEKRSSVAAFCVTSLSEANAFFGRDLETGAAVPQIKITGLRATHAAADHSMSKQEFAFFERLIAGAAARRFLSPDSATITIINNDGPGEGFNDTRPAFANPEGGNTGATRGEQRMNVFEFAAGIWGDFLDTSVPIQVRAGFDSMECGAGGAILGGAGPLTLHRDFTGAELPGTWYVGALANKQSGTDRSTSPDLDAEFNVDIDDACLGAGTRYYYGLNSSVPSGRINLLATVLHEIGHGVGFISLVDESTGALFQGLPDIWARSMFDEATGAHWDQMTDSQRQASAVSNGGLKWDGPSVRLASGFLGGGSDSSGRVQLYAPSPLRIGSSVSHFSNAASPNLLMEPSINSGLPIDLDLTRQLMRDIGWYRDTNTDGVPDTIGSVSPGAAFVTISSTANIRWINSGGFDRNVTIELSTDGGTTFPTTIIENAPNTGSYAWTVPNMPTNTARLRVREADFAAPSGISSSNFVINFAPTAANVVVSGRVLNAQGFGIPQVRVIFSSSSGEGWTARTNHFGYFVTTAIPSGETYVAAAYHKEYRFEARTVTLNEDLSELNFIAMR
ncbi:MAG: hypothetical protein WBD22_03355 [Pyrinomonadaceae bacterium]